MPIFLPRRWNRQPPYNAGVDWSNPLTRALISAGFADQVAGAGPVTRINSTTLAAGLGGMSLRFNAATSDYATIGRNLSPLSINGTVLFVGIRPSSGVIVFGTASNSNYSGFTLIAGNQGELLIGDNVGTGIGNRRSYLTPVGSTPVNVLLAFAICPTGLASGLAAINGVPQTLTYSGTMTTYSPGSGTAELGRRAALTFYGNSDIFAWAVWDRSLTQGELNEITRNPWQLFRPAANQTFYSLPAQGTAYSLALDAGSYTLTGQTLGLTSARNLGLDAGSYALTGRDVTLAYSAGTVSYTLSLDAGSYTLTGRDVGTSFARSLALDAGAYNLTGRDVAFNVTLNMLLDAGAYNLTGRIVGLTWSGETPVEITDRIVTLRSLTERWRM